VGQHHIAWLGWRARKADVFDEARAILVTTIDEERIFAAGGAKTDNPGRPRMDDAARKRIEYAIKGLLAPVREAKEKAPPLEAVPGLSIVSIARRVAPGSASGLIDLEIEYNSTRSRFQGLDGRTLASWQFFRAVALERGLMLPTFAAVNEAWAAQLCRAQSILRTLEIASQETVDGAVGDAIRGFLASKDKAAAPIELRQGKVLERRDAFDRIEEFMCFPHDLFTAVRTHLVNDNVERPQIAIAIEALGGKLVRAQFQVGKHQWRPRVYAFPASVLKDDPYATNLAEETTEPKESPDANFVDAGPVQPDRGSVAEDPPSDDFVWSAGDGEDPDVP
jgi:hypothetical protein